MLSAKEVAISLGFNTDDDLESAREFMDGVRPVKRRHTATWKNAEKKVAAIVGGKRINGARGVRKEDVKHHLFSIEVKHGKTSIPKFVTAAYKQACANAPEGKVPLVVLHNHGSSEYMAVLPLAELMRLINEVIDLSVVELDDE